MGFLDVFRKKRISTPEELLERIREIDQRIDEAERRLAIDIDDRLRMRFERFWKFEERLVRGQLNRIEDLFYLGSESGDANGAPAAGEAGAGETEPPEAEKKPEPPDPVPLSAEDMKWVKNILWHVWRRSDGTCFDCRGERELHFVPGPDEPEDALDDEPALQLTGEQEVPDGSAPAPAEGSPDGADADESPPEAPDEAAAEAGREAEASPGAAGPAGNQEQDKDKVEEEEPEPPIDESVTRQIIARLRLSCPDCCVVAGAEAQEAS